MSDHALGERKNATPFNQERPIGLLEKTKIGTKILSILLLLGLISIFISAYAAFKLQNLDTQYSELIDHEAAASMNIAMVNRDVVAMGYGTYMAVALDGASEQAQLGLTMQRTAKAEGDKLLASTASLVPEEAPKIQALQAQLSELEALSDTAMVHGMKNEDDAAKASELPADRMIASFIKSGLAVRADLHQRVDVRSDALTRVNHQDMMFMVGGAVLATLLGVGAGLFVSGKGITGPLNSLAERMRRLAGGDLEVVVEGQGRTDEVGGMARAVQVFKENALTARAQEAAAVESKAAAEEARITSEKAAEERSQQLVVGSIGVGLTKLSDGDLTYRINESLPEAYLKLQTDFNAAMEVLQEAMKTIVANTDGMLSGAGEISQAADDLSRRTEQQAASLEQTAAALDEITATVKRTAEGSNQANEVVTTAKADAEKSGEIVRQAVTAMNGIDKSAHEISQIIGVIDEIAFQTNLLALNAGVEAARAGDAGKGFAVVATEVRALAQRSAQAAKEIKALISTSTSQVKEGVDLVGQTGEALQRIVGQVAEITALVSEIAASAQEQATGLAEVNTAVNQMDQMTQQNAAMVEQSTAASHALAQEAQELGKLVGRFQIGERAGGPRLAVHKSQDRAKAFASQPRAAPQLKTTGSSAVAKTQSEQDSWEDF